MNVPTLHTGGTTGADSAWINCANLKKHHVKVYSFDGWKRTRIIDDEGNFEVIHLSMDEEELDNLSLEKVSKDMKKTIPATGYERNLLKRDCEMIKECDSLYAIGGFDKNSNSRLKVKGHTAWIVELYLNHLIAKNPNIHHEDCMLPIYFFNEDTEKETDGPENNKWYQLHHTKKENFRWICKGNIFSNQIPKPNKNYIGVGSRELTELGKNALLTL